MHHDRVVVVDDLDALDHLGHDRDRVDGRGDVDVEHRAGVDPVGLGRRLPVDADVALGDQVGGAGAGEPEHPGHRGVDALAGQAVRHGDGRGRGRCGRPGSTGSRAVSSGPGAAVSRAGATGAVEPNPADAWTMISTAATLMQHVGDVEDRPVRQREEVDDVAAQRRRAPGRSGRSGCRRTPASSSPSADRPTVRSPAAGRTTAPRPRRRSRPPVSTSVYDVPVLKAAPGLRARSSRSRSPTTCDRGAGR